MKKIWSTNGKCVLVDDDDYPALAHIPWSAFTNKGKKTNYALYRWWCTVEHRYRGISMHRMIMNPPEGVQVDHINGDGLDNRKCNLRLVNNSQNNIRSTRKDNKHGFRGVRIGNSGFVARVQKDGKEHYVGTFPDAVSAAKARDRVAIRLHGEFAVTNFPKEDYE